ncbi:DUF58 domain-containing protein [Natronoflexus pectinivorans]|uniref:Uncharacterized protein (DUF58 family) n=1 Tax=Natronoflexus pectinivorans TaxID=682526 RepID=A0A4R2GN87_9BACT|nr:DUF58 domain-containing protein [Natronoflexus pectinivorans]TCO10764.1 uncharacterized protein (DUF58 family) [Natronoflexus pectinivorans]
MKVPFKPLFINNRFYKLLGFVAFLYVLAFLWSLFLLIAWLGFGLFISLIIIDGLILFAPGNKSRLIGKRILPEKFSNGDENEVSILIESKLPFKFNADIIDEIPFQFQIRDFRIEATLHPEKTVTYKYILTPKERGEYFFGVLNVFIKGQIGLFSRRYQFDKDAMVKAYPSFIQMKQYEIMAISNRLSEIGIKKIRRIGHHTEFDQIRDYIKGDDIRTINWKATARKGHLMVNQYQDEKSQQVICVLDMGRTMKMAFNKMTLLDYAINTSLVLTNIAMLKHDKAGVITFNEKICNMLPPRREGHQMNSIMELLYNQKTGFLEHNLEALYATVKHRVHQRSLLVLFTNFESIKTARQQMHVLAKLAANHLLMVIFFENSEISGMIHHQAQDTEEIYQQAIAEKFIYEKKQIVKELERYGIHAILTNPENLTIDTINQYLELKARGII